MLFNHVVSQNPWFLEDLGAVCVEIFFCWCNHQVLLVIRLFLWHLHIDAWHRVESEKKTLFMAAMDPIYSCCFGLIGEQTTDDMNTRTNSIWNFNPKSPEKKTVIAVKNGSPLKTCSIRFEKYRQCCLFYSDWKSNNSFTHPSCIFFSIWVEMQRLERLVVKSLTTRDNPQGQPAEEPPQHTPHPTFVHFLHSNLSLITLPNPNHLWVPSSHAPLLCTPFPSLQPCYRAGNESLGERL